MCLLVVDKNPSPESLPLTRREFDDASYRNPHGIGIGYYHHGKPVVHKYLGNARKLTSAYDQIMGNIRARRPDPKSGMILHFRLATHGHRDEYNCHPFISPHGAIIAHNGVFSGLRLHGGESDTRAWVRTIANPLLEADALDGATGWLDDAIQACRSKVAILRPGCKPLILGQSLGHCRRSVWMSNYGYQPQQPHNPILLKPYQQPHLQGWSREVVDGRTVYTPVPDEEQPPKTSGWKQPHRPFWSATED